MNREQVSVDLMLDRAWREFDLRMLSIGASYTLWGSFKDADDLLSRFCWAKGLQRLLDKRRCLSDSEQEQLEDIRLRAVNASRYRDWARDEDGRPILREILVGYCTAFENALKSVAVSFELASRNGDWDPQFFVTAKELSEVIKMVQGKWKGAGGGRGDLDQRAIRFYRENILQKNPNSARWPFLNPESEENSKWHQAPRQHWLDCESAFRLRNDVVHANGIRGHDRIEVHTESFHPKEELALTTKTIRAVELAFRGILDPIDREGAHRL